MHKKDKLLKDVFQYRRAVILLSAAKSGLFDYLSHTAKVEINEVSEKFQWPIRGTEIILNALCALGYLKKRGRYYWIPDDLVELFSPENYWLTKEWMIHEWRLLNRWTHLIEVLETGMPFWEQEKMSIHRNHSNFIKSMAHREKENLSSMLRSVSLEGCHHLLDLGGGPGLFAIALVEKYPQLKATIFDTPETQPIARDFINASKAKSRVKFKAGDFLIDEIGDGYDVALLSSILHIYDAEQNEKLIAKVFAGLNVPGKIFVRDFFLNPSKTEPLVGALFAVNMLINTQGGNAYTYGEMKKWLMNAGFRKLRKIKLEGRMEIIVAEKITL